MSCIIKRYFLPADHFHSNRSPKRRSELGSQDVILTSKFCYSKCTLNTFIKPQIFWTLVHTVGKTMQVENISLNDAVWFRSAACTPLNTSPPPCVTCFFFYVVTIFVLFSFSGCEWQDLKEPILNHSWWFHRLLFWKFCVFESSLTTEVTGKLMPVRAPLFLCM